MLTFGSLLPQDAQRLLTVLLWICKRSMFPARGAIRAGAYQSFGNMTNLKKISLRSAVSAEGSNLNGNGSLKTVVESVADEKNETSTVRSRVFMLFRHWE